jgi:hypothetical protein
MPERPVWKPKRTRKGAKPAESASTEPSAAPPAARGADLSAPDTGTPGTSAPDDDPTPKTGGTT